MRPGEAFCRRMTVTRLYPPPAAELPLHGLYLAHDLRAAPAARPFVYASYLASLDGRIAAPHVDAPHPARADLAVPPAIANPRDWRLVLELAAQADVLLTSGRYLRERAAGRGQDILHLHRHPGFAGLAAWRAARGLPPQPALAVISASLDFPAPALPDCRLFILTARRADPARVRELSAYGEVIPAGEAAVDGGELVDALHARGSRLICNLTGPRVMRLLLAAGRLDRLYLTQAHRLLGGSPYASIVEGGLLHSPADFRLHELYLDAHGLDGAGQVFSSYNVVR
jgi:riboflavin biosynthesis pyrimidine reductase